MACKFYSVSWQLEPIKVNVHSGTHSLLMAKFVSSARNKHLSSIYLLRGVSHVLLVSKDLRIMPVLEVIEIDFMNECVQNY